MAFIFDAKVRISWHFSYLLQMLFLLEYDLLFAIADE
jgi:hypothetical protein